MSTQSFICSKVDSRRSSTFLGTSGLFLLVTLCLPSLPIAAQQPAPPRAVSFSYTVKEFPSERIMLSLRNGHRAEIAYVFRLYEVVHGLAGLFGDRLVEEHGVTYVARRDPVDGGFVVQVDSRTERVFATESSLISFLVTLEDHVLPFPEPLQADYYVLCRSRIEPIKLVPPLTLLSFLRPSFRISSRWERVALTRVVEEES